MASGSIVYIFICESKLCFVKRFTIYISTLSGIKHMTENNNDYVYNTYVFMYFYWSPVFFSPISKYIASDKAILKSNYWVQSFYLPMNYCSHTCTLIELLEWHWY